MSDLVFWRDKPHHVFLCHFGGPERAEQVEPFLFRLFSDQFIIRAPMGEFLRRCLAKFISSRRSQKTKEQYERIGYSPINRYTKIQAELLEKKLQAIHPMSKVHIVNRYTAPMANDVARKASIEANARVFILTLYPHFSHSTAGSSIRDIERALRDNHKLGPVIRVFSWWYNKEYLEYGARSIFEKINALSTKIKPHETLEIVFSAHGLPKKYEWRGDPYPHDIRAHAQELEQRCMAMMDKLNPVVCRWHLSFQSRVGPVEWIKPYTEDLVTQLGQQGSKHILMVPISFVSDHIETLYEMDILYRDLALKSGFQNYERTKVPNDDPALADILVEVLRGYNYV